MDRRTADITIGAFAGSAMGLIMNKFVDLFPQIVNDPGSLIIYVLVFGAIFAFIICFINRLVKGG